MKTIAIFLFFLSGFMTFAHEGHHHGPHTQEAKEQTSQPEVQRAYGEIQKEYERSIRAIFSEKCAACHSSSVPAPWYAKVPIVGWIVESDRSEAKEHLEISKGFPFAGHGTPEEDLKAIEKVTIQDEMPPILYRVFHSSSRLTSEEKREVTEWAKLSQQTLLVSPK